MKKLVICIICIHISSRLGKARTFVPNKGWTSRLKTRYTRSHWTKTPNVRIITHSSKLRCWIQWNSFRFMPSFFINSASFSVQKLFARCRDIFFIFSSALQLSSDLLKQHTVFPLFSRWLLLLAWFSFGIDFHRTQISNFFFFFFNVLMCIWKWTNFVATLYYQSQCDIRCFHSYSCALSSFRPQKFVRLSIFCFFLTSISYMQYHKLLVSDIIMSRQWRRWRRWQPQQQYNTYGWWCFYFNQHYCGKNWGLLNFFRCSPKRKKKKQRNIFANKVNKNWNRLSSFSLRKKKNSKSFSFGFSFFVVPQPDSFLGWLLFFRSCVPLIYSAQFHYCWRLWYSIVIVSLMSVSNYKNTIEIW